MSKELIVSATRHETRVAILEDDQLVEIYHQREQEYSLAGSIHKGRVTRVLPGMQSAFVDIGLERDAFLYVSDFFEDNEEYDKIVSGVEEKVLKLDKTGTSASPAPVSLATPIEPEMAAVLGAVPGSMITASVPAASTPQTSAPAGEPRRGEPRSARRFQPGRRARRTRTTGTPEAPGRQRAAGIEVFLTARGPAVRGGKPRTARDPRAAGAARAATAGAGRKVRLERHWGNGSGAFERARRFAR